MHKKIEITAAIIEKYHLGIATPEEASAVESWLNDSSIEPDIPKLSQQKRKEKKLAIWKGITQKNKAHQAKPRSYLFTTAIAIIACSCVAFAISFYIHKQDTKPIYAAHYQLKSVNGQKSRITLSDGTVIRLNAGSTLNYPDHFTGQIRAVQLDGEAYFEVAQNKNKPFIIHTKQGIVRVLGTKFNLKAFHNDLTESLSLDEGSVRYSDQADSTNFVLLSPHQHAVLNDPDNSFNVRPSKPQDAAWLQNQLDFNNLPLTEIAKQLERWYGVSIILKREKLNEQRYTGTYHNPSLNHLLEQLGYVMGFKYTINQKKEVTIY
jgi:transmembrane sensor